MEQSISKRRLPDESEDADDETAAEHYAIARKESQLLPRCACCLAPWTTNAQGRAMSPNCGCFTALICRKCGHCQRHDLCKHKV